MQFKKMTDSFNFYGVLDKNNLPAYARQYVKNEKVLTIYKTEKDHGVFTDKKIVLFENENKSKTIYTIPYKSISNLWITFNEDNAIVNLLLDSTGLISLRFVDMTGNDKLRLRILFTCMDKFVNGQNPVKEDIQCLIDDDIKL